MKVGPQLEYIILVNFRNRGISDLACNKNGGRFKMAAIADQKFFDMSTLEVEIFLSLHHKSCIFHFIPPHVQCGHKLQSAWRLGGWPVGRCVRWSVGRSTFWFYTIILKSTDQKSTKFDTEVPWVYTPRYVDLWTGPTTEEPPSGHFYLMFVISCRVASNLVS